MNKLTYKDCVELKKAGFPQDKSLKDYCRECKKRWDSIKCFNNKHSTEFIRVPTLEELIEACGKTKKGINHHKNEKGEEYGGTVNYLFRLGCGDGWFARYDFHNHTLLGKYNLPIDGWGNSPIQAVKNLYIALQTNNK